MFDRLLARFRVETETLPQLPFQEMLDDAARVAFAESLARPEVGHDVHSAEVITLTPRKIEVLADVTGTGDTVPKTIDETKDLDEAA